MHYIDGLCVLCSASVLVSGFGHLQHPSGNIAQIGPFVCHGREDATEYLACRSLSDLVLAVDAKGCPMMCVRGSSRVRFRAV